MSFILHPWQLLFVVFAGWVCEQQQQVIQFQDEQIRALLEKLGKKRILLTGDQRRRLAVKGKTLSRMALSELTTIVTADTILRWHRILVAQKWDYPNSIVGGFLGKQVSFRGRFTTIVTHTAIAPVLRMVLAAGFHDSSNIPNGYMKLLFSVPMADRDFPAGIKSLLKNFRSWANAADTKYPQILDDLPVHVIYGDGDWDPYRRPRLTRGDLRGRRNSPP